VASGDVYSSAVSSSEVSSGDDMATIEADVASVDVSFGGVLFGDVPSGEEHSVDMAAAEAEYSDVSSCEVHSVDMAAAESEYYDVASGDEDCEVKITSINLTLTKTETIKNGKVVKCKRSASIGHSDTICTNEIQKNVKNIMSYIHDEFNEFANYFHDVQNK